MIFEVIKDYNEVQVKSIPLPDGTRKEVYSQDMYMHKGGAFPVRFTASLATKLDQYPVGKFNIDPNSFTQSKYGNLELDRYNIKFIPVHEK